MRDFHKISLRPPWSIFIITQKPKLFSRQTQTIGKLTKLSKTFMFTPKANSKQKRVKKTQEHEKGYAATRLLAVASWRRANTALCREVRFLTPKTQFSSTLIQKLIGNSTYDHSTV